MKSRLLRVETVQILEALWLSAVFIIPTICVSQYFIVSEADNAHAQVPKIAALRTIAAALLITYLFHIKTIKLGLRLDLSPSDIFRHVQFSYETLVFIAVSLVTISTIVTTILSSRPDISIWGLIPGQDGYSAYNAICYLVIFIIVVTNLKTPDQFRRLLISIITMGMLVSSIGFFQHFGVNIFELLPTSGNITPDYSRASLTTGNAVTAASLLLIPILVTLACAGSYINNYRLQLGFGTGLTVRILIWSIVLTAQLSALLFTLSRGPAIATISSIFLMIVTLIIFRKFSIATIMIVVTLIASVSSLSINAIPINYQDYTDDHNLPQLVDRVADIKTQVTSGGLNQRLSIWKSSAELIEHRPWFDSMDQTFTSLRFIIGYGPGTFQPVFNLTSRPGIYDGNPLEANHAHNYFIHKAVTEGLIGALSSVALLTSPILMSGALLIFRRNSNTTIQVVVLSGIFAVFSGRLAEQLLGLARVSDLAIFWICLAGAVAAVKMFHTSNPHTTECLQTTYKTSVSNPIRSTQVFVLVAATLTILLFTSSQAIIYPVSGIFAGKSRSTYENGNIQGSLSKIETAISITPNVPYYYLFKSIILIDLINNPEIGLHPSCSDQDKQIANYEEYQLCIAEDLYSTLSTARQIEPFWYQSTFQFAGVAQAYNQDKDALEAYEHLAQLLPTNRKVLHLLSEEYIAQKMFSTARNTLNRSLMISKSNPQSGNNDLFINEATKLLKSAQ
ncbi:MAG: hypothetical protein CL785_03145 [Chloroflexi bacterium]|nr:hypothetical protein [Chloroflexota bacterium]|tara:strand:+ start:43701 stop:45899 length:2199 start_codon:yes stop_codon:yes gene_type:complete